MTVGRAISRIRHEQGMTQGEVSATAGIATSYVSRIENDHVQPTMATLGRVARALGVPVSSIFQVSESDTPPVGHRCPVSASGSCIGEQIRASTGRRPKDGKVRYGRQEMRILKMADYVALHGSLEVRRALRVVLESLMQRASNP